MSSRKEYQLPMKIVSTSWAPGIDEGCYGDIVRSAYVKLGGGENNHAVWTAEIQQEGVYELMYMCLLFLLML